MDVIALVGIAVGLSMDAFAVSIANGATCQRANKAFAIKMAACFGLFQAGMPMLGWLVGKAGESVIRQVDHWIALLLLGFLGVQMIAGALRKSKESALACDLGTKKLLALALATSIDALATGVILPGAVGAGTWQLMLISAGVIGVITFSLSYLGVFAGKRFGALLAGKAELVGGAVLILIGVKIFIEHMFL